MKCFFPLCPVTITLFISLSTIDILLLWNLLPAYLAPVFGAMTGLSVMYLCSPGSVTLMSAVSHLLNIFIVVVLFVMLFLWNKTLFKNVMVLWLFFSGIIL